MKLRKITFMVLIIALSILVGCDEKKYPEN